MAATSHSESVTRAATTGPSGPPGAGVLRSCESPRRRPAVGRTPAATAFRRIALLFVVALIFGACSSTDDETRSTSETSGGRASDGAPPGPATTPESTSGTSARRASQARVQIPVKSTADHYYVLYVRPDLTSDFEVAVSVTHGQEGTTTLTEGLVALPLAHYRVEEFRIDDPGDVDGDGIDDITELNNPVRMNPLNPAPAIDFRDGAVQIPDRETFKALSYQGPEVRIDTHLADLEFVKFYLLDMDTDHPSVYFMNTETHRAHFGFAGAVGIPGGRGGPAGAPGGGPAGGPGGGPAGGPGGGPAGGPGGGPAGGPGGVPGGRPAGGPGGGPGANLPGQMRGEIVFHPNVVAPDGSLGVYRFEFEPNDSYPFREVARAYELLAASMPLLDNNLAYYPMPQAALPRYRQEAALYEASRVTVLLDEDILPDVDFVALNAAEGYGLLRVMSQGEQPDAREVVIYEALPNELSRVGGIITTVPQTPLSHVNLRAVQDGVPNAFIRDALEDARITSLVGKYVYYAVDAQGFTIREATPAEVEAHFGASRPGGRTVPRRDLSVTRITPLDEIGFQDWTAFGVKAANVATLGTFGFPEGTIPDGFAIPFYFYDEFMKSNGLYERVEAMLASPAFRSDFATQEAMLADLRASIEDAPMPRWMMEELADLQRSFPTGTSIRCRSSTNNEDLPGFSGAGLYESRTQHPDEGHMSKCVKQVYASLWTFRAFGEREFHRIDHLATAMGVLTHPNYADEVANGVAVSIDPVYSTVGTYYVNAQIGEDLVTNPGVLSVPEEILLRGGGGYEVVRRSNQVAAGENVVAAARLGELQRYLAVIHERFADLYGVTPGTPFAMEIEFKITSDGRLAIKQARPWVFK